MTKNAHLFPEDIKTDCLSLLATMTESIHCYFSSNMHKELKVKATFCYFHYYIMKKTNRQKQTYLLPMFCPTFTSGFTDKA